MEDYATREFEVRVTEVGNISTAFMSDPPVVDPPSVMVGGSTSLLDQVDFLRVILDHSNKTEPISTDLNVDQLRVDLHARSSKRQAEYSAARWLPCGGGEGCNDRIGAGGISRLQNLG